MNHHERFFATIHHQPVDRPASWLGLPVPSAEKPLLKHFGVGSYIGEQIIGSGT